MNVKWLPKKDPWMPPDYDEDAIFAVRALISGVANEGQQKLAWSYIMYVCGTSDEWADLSWRPGDAGDRSTSFAEGKRFVGLMLRKLLRPELTPNGQKEDTPQTRLSKRMIAQRLRRQRERSKQNEGQ